MKNSIKLLTCAVLVASGLAAQAATPKFSALTLNGTGVGSVTATNNTTGTVTYSGKTVAFNNAFILSEFYASDVGTNYVAATGDKLAVTSQLRVYAVDTTSTIVGYQKLNNGVVQAIYKYTYTTNSLVGDVIFGEVVILNAKGQVKANLTRLGVVPPDNTFNEVWNYWSNNYIRQGTVEIDFNLLFGGNAESFNLYLSGGGQETDSYYYYPASWWGYFPYYPVYGDYVYYFDGIYGPFTMTGGGSAYIANPASALVGKTVLIKSVTATVPVLMWNWDWY